MKDQFLDRERKSAKRLASMQIPNSFKKVGVLIAAISFIGLIANKLILNAEEIRFLCRHGLIVGFLIISIARDKQEDEFIKDLRLKSYFFAFIFCVAYSVVMPYIDYLVDLFRDKESVLKDSGDFMILWMLICVQVFYFEYLKRLFK